MSGRLAREEMKLLEEIAALLDEALHDVVGGLVLCAVSRGHCKRLLVDSDGAKSQRIDASFRHRVASTVTDWQARRASHSDAVTLRNESRASADREETIT